MRLVLAALLLLGTAVPAAAQGREASVEASFVRGAVGLAREVRPGLSRGLEVGFGFPELDRTLVPEQPDDDSGPDFEEYFHIAALMRLQPSERVDIDGGVRASIADLFDSSGSWPEPFIGAYVQPMVGWRRLKVGMRLTAGWIFEPDAGRTDAVAWSPFLLRYTHSW